MCRVNGAGVQPAVQRKDGMTLFKARSFLWSAPTGWLVNRPVDSRVGLLSRAARAFMLFRIKQILMERISTRWLELGC